MSEKIIRRESEISKVMNKALEQEERGASRFPGMSYEQGVRAMYEWLVGICDDHPMEE